MRRREFIAFLGTSALPWTLPANAQSGRKIARIGVLWHAGSAEEEREYLTVLVKAFGDLGYIEGKNVEFLNKFPAEQLDRYPVLARELVDSNVDVAIAVALPGAVALKQITSTIPVVFVIVPDPIGLGLVAGLAHPGSNLTGLSLLSIDLSGKSLALLKEAAPNLSSVALFLDPQVQRRLIPAYAAAAKSLGLSFRSVEISAPDTIEPAFARAQSDRVDGIVVAGSMLFNERARAYGREAATLLVIPRATGTEIEPWRISGAMASLVSGAYVVSSNRVGRSKNGTHFGGGGFAYAPQGRLLALTTPSKPVQVFELDTRSVESAQRSYPCYVPELE